MAKKKLIIHSSECFVTSTDCPHCFCPPDFIQKTKLDHDADKALIINTRKGNKMNTDQPEFDEFKMYVYN